MTILHENSSSFDDLNKAGAIPFLKSPEETCYPSLMYQLTRQETNANWIITPIFDLGNVDNGLYMKYLLLTYDSRNFHPIISIGGVLSLRDRKPIEVSVLTQQLLHKEIMPLGYIGPTGNSELDSFILFNRLVNPISCTLLFHDSTGIYTKAKNYYDKISRPPSTSTRKLTSTLNVDGGDENETAYHLLYRDTRDSRDLFLKYANEKFIAFTQEQNAIFGDIILFGNENNEIIGGCMHIGYYVDKNNRCAMVLGKVRPQDPVRAQPLPQFMNQIRQYAKSEIRTGYFRLKN